MLENQTDIWLIYIPDVVNYSPYYEQLLVNEEKEKANHFVFLKDKLRYVITHGILRLLLSDYLNLSSRQIVLKNNSYGKPYLSTENHPESLFFNLSHSNLGIVLAFAKSMDLGIDLEFVKKDIPFLDIAKHFFSQFEYQELLSTPEISRIQAFYHGWTRKEAFIKAKGKGLSIPLDSFDVSISQGKQPAILRSSDDPMDLKNWKLFDLDTWPDYTSALCIEGEQKKINFYHWDN
jgi:4'-phosphopantetheinyl transferase